MKIFFFVKTSDFLAWKSLFSDLKLFIFHGIVLKILWKNQIFLSLFVTIICQTVIKALLIFHWIYKMCPKNWNHEIFLKIQKNLKIWQKKVTTQQISPIYKCKYS